MTINEKTFRALAKHAAERTAPTNFSYDQVEKTFRENLKELAGDFYSFQKNKILLYSIIAETADEIVPVRVQDAIGRFAEIRNVAQGDKPLFTSNIGHSRAKRFITQVGLSGVYETFRLDKKEYTVSVSAIGGATRLDFERLLDGAEVLADFMKAITEGLVDAVFIEIQKALIAGLEKTRPAANKVVANNFNPKEMFKLASTVKAYGSGSTGVGLGSAAVIFAPPQFIYQMGLDTMADLNGGTAINPSNTQIDEIRESGYITLFRGIPVLEIPQSYVDESNTEFTVRPDLAYVLPTGGEKIVKVVLEGDTIVWEYTNRDQSMEINAYKKIGVGIETYHNWGIYQDTSLTAEYKDQVDPRLGEVK